MKKHITCPVASKFRLLTKCPFNDESINTKSNFPSFAIRTISLSVFCVEPLEYPQNNLSKAFSIKISFVINVPPVNEKPLKHIIPHSPPPISFCTYPNCVESTLHRLSALKKY